MAGCYDRRNIYDRAMEDRLYRWLDETYNELEEWYCPKCKTMHDDYTDDDTNEIMICNKCDTTKSYEDWDETTYEYLNDKHEAEKLYMEDQE